jgi:nitroreductase
MTALAPKSATNDLGRVAEAEIAPEFVARWSHRALSERPIPSAHVDALFEAARWAPSANNLQPWLFVFAREPAALAEARSLLKDVNQTWAVRAPLLVFVFARKVHPETGAPLRTAQFDTGAAWQSLALQAHKLGLSTRAMGGIHHERVYEALGVPEDQFESIAGIAIGYPDAREVLPEALREKETPTSRKGRGAFVFEGRYQPREPAR